MNITIHMLPSGYWHARGDGPCNWAQWPKWEQLTERHFFPEAGSDFKQALYSHWVNSKTDALGKKGLE